jgi:hypothetical protein
MFANGIPDSVLCQDLRFLFLPEAVWAGKSIREATAPSYIPKVALLSTWPLVSIQLMIAINGVGTQLICTKADTIDVKMQSSPHIGWKVATA